MVVASVSWAGGEEVVFEAGDGVGKVTKPGLSIAPGEAAINPVPRKMIARAIREVTERGVKVIISIPGGRELAQKTFNPRLGIEGGLSILGTTGRVRPFSVPARRDALRCSLDVAAGCGVSAPVLVPGHIGERAARAHFDLSEEQVVEVSNEWGFVLDSLEGYPFERILLVGHPGKLVKLAAGQWDTHSSRSKKAVSILEQNAVEILGHPLPELPTAEGLFAVLPRKESGLLAGTMARKIRMAVEDRVGETIAPAVVLIDMKGCWLGHDGDLTSWNRIPHRS
jgi:cobalt-precorrin-5B (C1)-methyltransferase